MYETPIQIQRLSYLIKFSNIQVSVHKNKETLSLSIFSQKHSGFMFLNIHISYNICQQKNILYHFLLVKRQ